MEPADADGGRAAGRGLSDASGSRPPVEPLHLVAGTELAHVPNAERPRLLVPLEAAAVRFALERLGRTTWGWRLARLAGRVGLGRALLAARFPVRAIPPHAEVEPLFGRTGEPFVVQVGTGGNLVVHLLQEGTVAKVSADRRRAEREALALGELGESARAAGAEVPSPVVVTEVDGVGVLVETHVAGRPLAWTLQGAARRFPDVLERLADWLAAWHRLTVQRDVDAPTPLVATHGDLTSSNVLFERERLGIVDWEHARADGLPLTDFLYAAADLAWAADRRRDRVAAFDDCFASGGRWTELVAHLERRVRDAVDLSDEAAAGCFRACWAHHAANELRASGGRPAEFAVLAARAAEVRP